MTPVSPLSSLELQCTPSALNYPSMDCMDSDTPWAHTDQSQVDRNEHFFGVEGLHFPHWENADIPLIDTVLDGELVIDIDPATGQVGHLCSAFTSFLSIRLTSSTNYDTTPLTVLSITESTSWTRISKRGLDD